MSYKIQVWRNPPEEFTPTIDDIVSDEKLGEYLRILIGNIEAKTSEPLVQRIEVQKLKDVHEND